MKKYLNSVVAKFDTTASGNAATGTTITVRDSSTGLKVALYSDDGVTSKSNPFTVDNNGNYEFYVADGRYDIYQDEGLPSQLVLRDVSIFDVSINFGAPKTVTALVSNIFNFGVGSLLTVGGYASQGDGGTGQWIKTADTDTASQSPLVRQDGTLTDLRGAVWRLVTSGYLDPRAVGFVGTGNETSALKAAVAAVGEGGTVKLDKKYNFTIDALDTKCTTVDFANSEVISAAFGFALYSEGSFSNQVAVSSVSSKTVIVADASGYNEGDVVKITCTDEQPDFWDGNRYLGQFATIDVLSGNTLTLDRKIHDFGLYQNNVTLFKLDKKTAKICNLTISPVASYADHAPLVTFFSLYKPVMENVNIVNSKDVGMNYISCYGYVNKDCSVINSLDNAATRNFGYGIYDQSCDGGFVINFLFNGGRHAFTNGGATTRGGLDERCGYSTNCRVVDSIARAATTGAWDTHPGFIDISFENCEAYDSGNFGQIRSRNVRFIQPFGRGLQVGIAMAGGQVGATINPASGAEIINADLEYNDTGIAYYEGDPPAGTDPAEIRIEGGIFKPLGNFRGLLLEARNSPIIAEIKNVTVKVRTLATDAIIFLGVHDGHEVNVNGLDVFVETNSGGNFGVVRGSSSFSAISHDVSVQRVTFTGVDSMDLSAAANMDAYINDVRAKSANSLTAVIGGTSLTWGGAV
jgi:uncharacterized protein YqfB (UPF0267 family)